VIRGRHLCGFNSADGLPTGKQKLPMVRWVAGALCILYGFAKLNGSQFAVLDSEMTKPLGQVSGFWLTWYYFGYSMLPAPRRHRVAAPVAKVVPCTP
jgi:hypothetical protein